MVILHVEASNLDIIFEDTGRRQIVSIGNGVHCIDLGSTKSSIRDVIKAIEEQMTSLPEN